MRTIESPSAKTKKPFTGERAGVYFYQGRANVEDDAKAAELVTFFGYVDVTPAPPKILPTR